MTRTLIADQQTSEHAADRSAELQQATRGLAATYERHAYLVYNLALRTTCERDAAMTAAEQAFLSATTGPADEATLAKAAVTAALATARRRPQPSGAGAPEAEELLATTAALQPAERAALAVSTLAEAGNSAVAECLGLAPAAAGRMLAGAVEHLTARLGKDTNAALASYNEWLWAQPPDELWECTYQSFYAAVEKIMRQGVHAPGASNEAPTQDLTAVVAEAAAEAKKRKPPRAARRRRGRLIPALLGFAPLLIAAGAIAWPHLSGYLHHNHANAEPKPAALTPGYTAPVGGGQAPAATPLPDAPPTDLHTALTTPHKPLTPQQLDKLRLAELLALKRYTKQQADKNLSAEQRQLAAKKVSLLRQLAISREEAAARVKALKQAQRDQRRQQRADARARRIAARREQQQQQTTTSPSQPPKSPGGTGTKPKSGGSPPSSGSQQQSCLYNQDTGEYICQQG